MLWLFDTCGLIVGPAIVLAGLVALGLCLRASRRGPGGRRPRTLLAAAALPAVLGVAGAAWGLAVWWSAGAAGDPRAALGKVCLAGAVVAAPPLAWAGLLARTRVGPRTVRSDP